MTHRVPFLSRSFDALARHMAAMWRDESGSPAVEFVMIAPFFVLILAATFDIGMIINARFVLTAQVSAASNFGQMRGHSITDGEATAFAEEIALLVSGGRTSMDVSVALNNAANAVVADGIVTTTDPAGALAQCYCPTRTNGTIQWGAAQTCLTQCTDGSTSGRFIGLEASTQHLSLFGGFGMTEDNMISTIAVVRMQ